MAVPFFIEDRKFTRREVRKLPQAAFDYHYGLDAERYAFFRIPTKCLFISCLLPWVHFNELGVAFYGADYGARLSRELRAQSFAGKTRPPEEFSTPLLLLAPNRR